MSGERYSQVSDTGSPEPLVSKKLSPLKPLGQMNRNLVGSILGKSFINSANLVPIR